MIDVMRIMGTETEYALLDATNPTADPEQLAVALLRSWAVSQSDTLPASVHVPDPFRPDTERHLVAGAGCRFDYSGEHPERDARGFSHHELPPEARTDEELGAVLTKSTARWVSRVDTFGEHYYRGNATHVPNGARIYIDHTHPENATPECFGPKETVAYEKAGDRLMLQAARALNSRPAPHEPPKHCVVVKNNTDGTGAAWGAHENYLMQRDTDWDTIVQVMLPFLTTRQIYGGSGRLGIGSESETPGFQIFQRADYIEDEVSLYTTHQRPIINTRDEPHALPSQFRRFHVITADSSVLAATKYLCLGASAAVLDLIEKYPQQAVALAEKWRLMHPVSAIKHFSRDTTLRQSCPLARGGNASAWDIQAVYLDACMNLGAANAETSEVLELWGRVLAQLKQGWANATTTVEWCAKLEILQSLCDKYRCDFTDPRLKAADLQFSLLDSSGLGWRLEQAGRVDSVVDEAAVTTAMAHGPASTRAGGRAAFFRAFPQRVWAASWTSWLLDVDKEHLLRVQLPDPAHPTRGEVEKALHGLATGDNAGGEDVLTALKRLGLELPAELYTVGWDEGFYADYPGAAPAG